MFDIRHETPSDHAVRDAILDSCFGPERLRKTSERLREGRLPAQGLALVATRDTAVVGTIRLWNVTAGPGRAALLLGPVAVDPSLQGAGIGAALIGEALGRATTLGHRAVLLVGDAAYYERFGFRGELVRDLWLPGPYEAGRFQGLDLAPGALAGAKGLVQATGARLPRPDWSSLIRAAEAPAIRAAA